MSETAALTCIFLTVGVPLYVAVGIVGADRAAAGRRSRLLRRAGE